MVLSRSSKLEISDAERELIEAIQTDLNKLFPIGTLTTKQLLDFYQYSYYNFVFMVLQGRIPSKKVGALRRYSIPALARWLVIGDKYNNNNNRYLTREVQEFMFPPERAMLEDLKERYPSGTLTMNQLMEYLQVSRPTIMNLIDTRQITFNKKVGKRWRFSITGLAAWMAKK